LCAAGLIVSYACCEGLVDLGVFTAFYQKHSIRVSKGLQHFLNTSALKMQTAVRLPLHFGYQLLPGLYYPSILRRAVLIKMDK
jgi:hypothetical protein